MKSRAVGYACLSIILSIILLFIIMMLLQPSTDEGLLFAIGILISLQISFLTGWTVNKLNQINNSIKRRNG